MSLYWHFPIQGDRAIGSAPPSPATAVASSVGSSAPHPALGRLDGARRLHWEWRITPVARSGVSQRVLSSHSSILEA
jgi:hypothetical protein